MSTEKLSEFADFTWAVRLHRYTMGAVSLWPEEQSPRKQFFTNLRFLLIISSMIIVCLIPCLHAAILVHDDLLALIDNLQFTLPLVVTFVKLIAFRYKQAVLTQMIQMISEDWEKPMTSEERNIMVRRSRISRILAFWTGFLMVVSFTFVVVLPIFGITFRHITNATGEIRLLLVQSHYTFDMSSSPNYEFLFVAQAFCLTIAGVCYTSMDNFFMLLILHICGQMEILQLRLQRMEQIKFDHALAATVKDHIRLLRSVKIVDDTFNLMFLALLSYFGLLFWLYGILIIQVLSQDGNVSMFRLSFIISVCLNTFCHICFCCVAGEILVFEVEQVYHAICIYEWDKLTPRQARDLIPIMIRAQKPLYLTAGKIFPMTMTTFCSMLKMSAGYVSFMITKLE